MLANVKIEDRGEDATVLVDGKDISGKVTAIRYVRIAGQPPKLILELTPQDFELNAEKCEVKCRDA